MKRNFSTGSLTAGVTLLKALTAPKVFYANGVLEQIHYLVDKCPKEVGWLGLVEPYGNGDYLITEIFVPEQTVHGAETDIASDAMAALAMELMNAGKDPGKLRYWGHSHVNMGVSPSTTDEEQVAEYLETCDFFIRGIYNKAKASKVDVYNCTDGVAFQCVTNTSVGLPAEVTAQLDELIKNNVKEAVFQTTYHQGYQHGYQQTNHQKKTHTHDGNASGQNTKTTNTVVHVIGKGAKEFVESLKKTA